MTLHRHDLTRETILAALGEQATLLFKLVGWTYIHMRTGHGRSPGTACLPQALSAEQRLDCHSADPDRLPPMCFVALLSLISPRLALFAVWIFSDLLSRAYDDWIIPVLGFFLLPWTTLAYAVMFAAGSNEVTGFEWFIVILAFVVDLGSYLGGSRSRSRERS